MFGAMLRLLIIFSLLSFVVSAADTAQITRGVVKIHVNSQKPNYAEPWKPGNISGGTGSGFLIAGQRIMTNAHVVSNARDIHLQKEGDPKRYAANVKFIAHDCDLALLEVADESFFNDMEALPFGAVPDLNSTVVAFGYPIGGKRLSVTRGIVSRLEFRTYAHSALDAHLAIQVDAAINPGNSGGPILQNGKVIAVAFQGFPGAVAQNTGYGIPVPVIERFLTDVEDGTYHGYVELAVNYSSLRNPAMRSYLGLPQNKLGVRVHEVIDAGSAAGKLQEGDILLSIAGHEIYYDGRIQLDGSMVRLEEIVERRFQGDAVTFRFLREGREQQAEVELKGAWPYMIFARRYDVRPRYFIVGGLVFQPLSRNFLGAHKLKDVEVMHQFNYFVQDEIYKERRDLIVLSNVLADRINSSFKAMRYQMVDKVNGEQVRSLRHMHELVQAAEEHIVIELLDEGRPIVLNIADLKPAEQRIRQRYQIPDFAYLGEEE